MMPASVTHLQEEGRQAVRRIKMRHIKDRYAGKGYIRASRQAGRQTGRQADRQADRQAGRNECRAQARGCMGCSPAV